MAQSAVLTTQETKQEIAQKWWVWLLWGACAIIIGILLLTRPITQAVTLTFFVGVWWVVSGVIDIFTSIARRRGPWGWFIFTGIISVLAGVFLMSRPIIATLVLANVFYYVMAFTFIFVGIVRMFSGYRTSSGVGYQWTWGSLIIGVLLFLLGLFMLFNSEAGDNFFVVVSTFGLLAVFAGIASIIFAFQVRSLKA